MSDEFNKYQYLRDTLTKELVSVGGELFAYTVGQVQMERLDPESREVIEMKGADFMLRMMGANPRKDLLLKFNAVMELLNELKQRQDEAAVKLVPEDAE